MAHRLELPQCETIVSQVEGTSATVTLRLVTDYLPEITDPVYEIEAHDVQNIAEALSFLREVQSSDEGVYAFWSDEGISFSSGDGGECTLLASEIHAKTDSLNQNELREALSRVHSLYQAEYQLNCRQNAQLNRMREMLQDQRRRTEAKASTHESSSTAGVLYAQQLRIIERLLNEYEI